MSRRSSSNQHSGTALFSTNQEKCDLEARNGLLQFDETLRLIGVFGTVLRLTPDIVCDLQRLAIQDIYTCAGTFRTGPIAISGTNHQPPHHDDVPKLVEEMCDYANRNADRPIHVASYLMWRHNWIHPFFGGNGRTSRAISYLALSVCYGFVLPGNPAIPEQIVSNRDPYYAALDAADAAWSHNQLDVSVMETLMETLLAKQLSQP